MADKDVALKLRVDGQEADKTVKSFKQQLREANAELISVSEKFGATSKEAINAAKRVAQLKDAIGDAKAMADAFSPDAKFAAFSGALRGVAGGFAGVQGAMALFGSESENLQKTLLKVQAAMALSEGLNAITGSIDAFKNLGAVIKSSVVTAFSTLRGAMMATGIGALVVAVGALVTNFGGLRDKIYDLIPGLKTVTDFVGGLVQRFTDFVGITSEAERALDRQNEALQSSIKSNQEWLDRNGDKFDEYTKRKIDANIKYKESLLALNKDETKSEEQKQRERAEWAQWLNRQVAKADADRTDAAVKAAKERQEKLLQKQYEADQAKKEAEDRAFAEELARLAERAKRRGEAEVIAETQLREIRLAEEKKMQDQKDQMAQLDQGRIGQVLATTKSALMEEVRARDEQAKQNQANAIMQVEAERYKTQQLTALTMALSDIVGQQTIAGKALAVASATINTYQAASEALKANYGIFGPAAQVARVLTVAAVVAQGLANVKRIVQTQVPGRAGGGGAGISIPTSATQLPTAAIAPTASPTAINQELLDRQGNAAVRAYVVDTDNVSGVERLQRVQRAARLG